MEQSAQGRSAQSHTRRDVTPAPKVHSVKYYVADELSLVPILWRAARGKPTVVLSTDALCPPLQRHVARIIARLEGQGRLTPLYSVLPDLHPAWHHSVPLLANRYEEIEAALEAFYDFGKLAALPAPYSDATRQVISVYVGGELATIHAVDALVRGGQADLERIMGLRGGVANLCRFTASNGSPIGDGRPKRNFNGAINVCQTVGMFLIGALRIFRHLSRTQGPEARVGFAFDDIGDSADLALCREIMDEKTVLMVERNAAVPRDWMPAEIPQVPRCRTGSGTIPFRSAPAALAVLAKDLFVVWRACRNFEARVFYRLITLPLKRFTFRAFFERYPVDVFWSRDQYNADHILRHHELKLKDGRMWGVLHGCPSYAALYPAFRYMSFDRYYVMTPSLFEGRARDRWPQDMKLKGVETFRASRQQFDQISEDRPPNILFMSSIWTGQSKFVSAIREVALAFPDRTVFVQTKPPFRNTPKGEAFVRSLESVGDNLVITDRSPYDLFAEARYAVSDPSTIVLEAIQFGLFSLLFDIPEKQKVAFHRHIDGFSVTSGEEIIDRLRGIEHGSWQYPIDALGELIRRDGEHFLDTVRRDLNLRPRFPRHPVWPDGVAQVSHATNKHMKAG